MLRQRVITALVLLAIIVPTLVIASPAPFVCLATLLIGAACWEWARLSAVPSTPAVVLAVACGGFAVAAWWLGVLQWNWAPVLLATGLAWALIGAGLLRGGAAAWSRLAKPLRLLGGLVALWLAWVAVCQARVLSVNFLLSVLALVWAADIAAYFAGRALGLKFTRTRLAPSISPGKSWEGVWGGFLGVLVLAMAWIQFDAAAAVASASFYTRLWTVSPQAMLLAVFALAGLSVVGDLVESLVKRSAGVKDSSGLLPGHGGVLDRIDALIPTVPLAVGLVAFLGAKP